MNPAARNGHQLSDDASASSLARAFEEACLALRTKYVCALWIAALNANPSRSREEVLEGLGDSMRSKLWPDPEPTDAEIAAAYDWDKLERYGLAPWHVLRIALAEVVERIATRAVELGSDPTAADTLAVELRCTAGVCPGDQVGRMLSPLRVLLRQLERKEGARSKRAAKSTPKGLPPDSDVLGTQSRTRLRRLAVLRCLPQASNAAIVAELDEFGEGGPDDSTVSKDLKALRKHEVVHKTMLRRTSKGDDLLKRHSS
ncbi:MAG: hypothetical protein IPK26_22385 [Planctomycetes bacterium]|nr:hypothetical protein [Planctomycetota bacterium]